MSILSEQVNKIRKAAKCVYLAADKEVADDISSTLNQAADTIEALSAKLQAANMENGGGWIPADEPPKDSKEVLVFNGKSYSVGYYYGKEWVNAIHPVKWKPIEP